MEVKVNAGVPHDHESTAAKTTCRPVLSTLIYKRIAGPLEMEVCIEGYGGDSIWLVLADFFGR